MDQAVGAEADAQLKLLRNKSLKDDRIVFECKYPSSSITRATRLYIVALVVVWCRQLGSKAFAATYPKRLGLASEAFAALTLSDIPPM